jgi:hypothetical protein
MINRDDRTQFDFLVWGGFFSWLILCTLFLVPVKLKALSNCVQAGSCTCTTTAGSTTFMAIANSAYTSPLGTSYASVDCIESICIDSFNSCTPTTCGNLNVNSNCAAVWMPHGFDPNKLFWILCWHGGGGFSGYSITCLGGSSNTDPIQLIQLYIDTPNPIGGKGIGVVFFDYPWSNDASVCPNCGGNFPIQFYSVACGISYVEAGISGLLSNAPVMLGYYGPSWGGELAFWAGNVKSSAYGTSSTCLSPDKRPALSRTVSAWPLMSWCNPLNLSSYTNNSSSAVTQALNDQFQVSSYGPCQTADSAAGSGTGASPYLQISSANLGLINTNSQFFQFGSIDPIVVPTWAGGGNYTDTVNAYTTLGLTANARIYAGCDHECDLGKIGSGTMADAFNFLLNVPVAQGGGAMGIGGNAEIAGLRDLALIDRRRMAKFGSESS